MKFLSALIISVFVVSPCIANPSNPMANEHLIHFSYILIVFILLCGLIMIHIWRQKKNCRVMNHCQILEKMNLGPKTTIYIIDYQHQHFMLAENSTAICLHHMSPQHHDA